jgi:hypothetical protein
LQELRQNKEKQVYAMPRIAHKRCAQKRQMQSSEAEKIADFHKHQLIVAVGGTALLENPCGRIPINRQIAEGALFGWRQWPAAIAAEIGLQIEQLAVRQRGVVIDDHAAATIPW